MTVGDSVTRDSLSVFFARILERYFDGVDAKVLEVKADSYLHG